MILRLFILFCCISRVAFAGCVSDPYVKTRLMAYLDSVKVFSAEFIQHSSGHTDASGIVMRNVREMRWEYYLPVSIVMVIRNQHMIYYDNELRQKNIIPINGSIYGLINGLDVGNSISFCFDRVIGREEYFSVFDSDTGVSLEFRFDVNLKILNELSSIGADGERVDIYFSNIVRNPIFNDDDFIINDEVDGIELGYDR